MAMIDRNDPAFVAAVAAIRAARAQLPENRPDDPFAQFENLTEILSYVVAVARSEGRDPLRDLALMFASGDIATPAARREAARNLQALGYSPEVVALVGEGR
jgi:hypothetical protein